MKKRETKKNKFVFNPAIRILIATDSIILLAVAMLGPILGFPVLFVLMALLAFGSAAYIFVLPRKVL